MSEAGSASEGEFGARLRLARQQMEFARNYTTRLLDRTDAADWFRQPPGGVTHISWQVGHLAMAQYRLALERVRGFRPADAGLISADFLQRFARESVPQSDPAGYPQPAEICSVFDRVHEQSLRELDELPESELDQPVLRPHPLATTKFLALIWCAQHEMLHAGQIGLLRRSLGYAPLW